MFQEYEVKSQGEQGSARLALLRSAMKQEGVTAFLVPHADEHQNEYLPQRAERLSWLTGFTGSAGFCVVMMDKAAVFSDGRYTVQLGEQIDTTCFDPENLIDNPPSKWLETHADQKDIIAYDPWLMTLEQIGVYERVAKKTGASLKPVENLIDRVWQDQPPKPMGQVTLHDVQHAGKASLDKIADIQGEILQKDCHMTILNDPASLAWLFNMRGKDVVHNPLALGFAIVPAKGKPQLFIEDEKLNETVKADLLQVADLHEPDALLSSLQNHSAGNTVLCDPNRIPVAMARVIEEAEGRIVEGRDPVILPRAIKNETELEGARRAHIRDGVAMCKFLAWLDQQTPGTLTEIDAAKRLEELRASTALAMGSELKEISFDTISAAGAHAALPHYRVNTQSNRTIAEGEIYLVDSGGQYEDGTTDITRTIAIGELSPEIKTDFTLVLKGHIAIDQLRFPPGTRGIDIDVLARHALWQHGKDYAHGSGHGIGSYLNVHEGPQGIHRRSMEVLKPGMIISNEPGYYVVGSHGIRIENLVIVKEAQERGGNIKTHSFENITWTPIDKRLIDRELLNNEECDWLNAYHAQVYERISPHLKTSEQQWLKEATSHL